MTSVGRYTFAAWLRRGVGTRISQTDRLGTGGSGIPERATVPVDVVLNGQPVSKSFSLIGPGDIIGVNPHMVVRTEPRAWITNFEPNYLAYLEFYDEDFPWRYTPARPNGQRLSPWLALLVLEAPVPEGPGEFELTDRHDPLPSLRVTDPAALPALTDNWAFTHVATTEAHDSPTDFEAFLDSLREPGQANADKIIARVTSPRRLEPDTAYRAFLVPAFETGRLAGLHEAAAGVDSQAPAWTPGTAVELPYYYDWYFRTGENEDFESLVKQLEPRPVDERVGIRDMDATEPGFGVATGADIGSIPAPPVTDGPPAPAPSQTVLGLEGALKSPQTRSRPETVQPGKPFFTELAAVLNAADDRVVANPGPVDPLVTPPIYGGHHAEKSRVDFATAGWLTTLNRDPRLRAPSGLGTRVVQTHQEDYVARAWSQVTEVLAMNRRVILGRLAMEAVTPLHATFVSKLPPGELLSVAKPVTRKVMGSPTTIARVVSDSLVTDAPLDAATRRLVRRRGVVARRIRAADPEFSHGALVEAINSETVTAAPPKEAPDGLPSDVDVADAVDRDTPLSPWHYWLRRLRRWLWWILAALLLMAIASALLGLWPLAVLLVVLAVAAYVVARLAKGGVSVADGLRDPALLVDVLGGLPAQPGFGLIEVDPLPRPGTPPGGAGVHMPFLPGGLVGVVTTSSHPAAGGPGGTDSVEAASFRPSGIALAERLGVLVEEPKRPALALPGLAGKLVDAMDPKKAWPILISHEVVLAFAPEWLKDPEHLTPAMAYPDFDDPMYQPLRDLSSELLLPNLGLIPPDTITLLVTNPEFIEGYLVGLNHEFGRELLWREYPTDQRGSYFRQFWSVRGLVVPPESPPVSPEQLKARYRDISALDTWTTASDLGHHPPPERGVTGDLVLTIRGELLKKYPNTLIYAQKAHMARNRAGQLDAAMKPVIRTVSTRAEMDAEIRFPLFTAEVEPDIRFFGFDLTVAAAQGADHPTKETDDWGWYFVIQEIPGEPRFGMDVEFDPDDDPATPITWNDLSWDRMPDSRFVSPAGPPVPSFFNLVSPTLRAQWGRHSADMAAVLFQRPVMIAVHAREMLEELDG